MTMTNLCVRCGKQRIVSREWQEEIKNSAGVSVVTFTQTVCPDSACQKIVEEKQAVLNEKANEIKRNFEKRAADKRAERARLKAMVKK